MPRQKLLHANLAFGIVLHYVVPNGAVDVNIHKAGRNNALSEVPKFNLFRYFLAASAAHADDGPDVDDDQRILDDVGWREQQFGCESNHCEWTWEESEYSNVA
jgi:hypothetical protein